MFTASGTNTLVNNIIWGNSGGSIFNAPTLPSTNTISFSTIQGGATGNGNLNVDPLFVNAANEDFSLQPSSPAVNVGSNSDYLNLTNLDPSNDIDLVGNPRLFGTTIDMGAFELQTPGCPPSNIIYVNALASGENDGSSWQDAYVNLQDALDINCPGVTEIWIAAGIYKPSAYPNGCEGCSNSRDYTFLMKDGISLYGGFAGTETQLSQRDLFSYNTTLSGDIGIEGNASDNVYHVVLSVSDAATTVLDGFTVSGGNANGNSSTTVESEFIDRSSGAGVFNHTSFLSIYNTTLTGNSASDFGAGMANESSSPTINKSSFIGNSSVSGAGVYNVNSSPIIINSIFNGNSVTSGGGAMENLNSNPIITNTTFTENTATFGGGAMFNISSNPVITNSILWGNETEFSNNAGSNPSVNYSIFQGGYSGTGNLDQDPQFVDAANGDFRLSASSPAINSGSNSTYTAISGTNLFTDMDLAGNPRLYANIIDIGALEGLELPCPPGNILFVDTNANGNNTGVSWANAFTDLQSALQNNCPNVAEIWVAQGTYYPDLGIGQTDNDRNATFQLINGVAIYGGFTGNETQLSERNWTTNQTILSGDINQSGDLTGNSYSLVDGSGTNTTAIIDVFTITGGNADVTSGDAFNPNRSGGGMFNNAGSPTVINCTFSGNTANQRGGGIYNNNSSAPTITNSTFLGNNAIFGGGMFNDTASSPIVAACAFSENSATSGGGGMYNFINASPIVINSTFSENTSNLGGGMTNSDNSSTTVINCTFSANLSVSNGGALFNFSSAPTIINTIIWNNTANGSMTSISASVFNNSSSPAISYSLIANSGGSDSWNASIGTNNGDNIDADPLFTDAANGDYSLQSSSPTINSGSNAAYQTVTGNDPANDLDLAVNPRLFGNTIDMGAFESQEIPCPQNNILYVNISASGNNDGASWSNAYTDLQDALNSSCSNVAEIWVAQGIYYPDEGIGITDNDRNAIFQLKNGVAIYGGFTGNETQLSERNWTTNQTILSGDINQSGNLTVNSYSVVTGSGTDNTAEINGFTITKGNANGSTEVTGRGAGMLCNAGSPRVFNCVFLENSAVFGAGMYNVNASSPTLINCQFINNQVSASGGGMLNIAASPVLANTVFSGNSAANGGGLFNQNSSVSLTNTTFSENIATDNGGGIYNGFSTPTLINSIIWNNTAGGNTTSITASVFNSNSTASISHSLIANSGGSGSWNGAIGTDNGNNIDADPLFTDAANGDYSLQPGSIAYNAGNNAAYQTATGNDPVNATDLAGNPRLFDAIIDMGAIERQELPCPSSNILYVNANANGNNTGISWNNAFVDLQSALESTCTDVEEIWIAAGTYYPSSVNDRNETFLLKNNLALYGGFTGNETQLSERDWENNSTILSGDINQSGNLTGNSYTLVNGSGTDTTAIIDGFTITGGNADVTSGDAFNPNRSGGGMFNNAGSPTVSNCTFSGNTANQRGGGIYNSNSSAPTITNSTFLGNNAIFGGGMFNDTASSPTVAACAFSGNSATSGGGGMYNFINTSPIVINSNFSENTSNLGGGMTNSDNSSTTVINCTFSDNLATSNGGALFNFSSAPTIINTIIWNNTANGITTTTSTSVFNDSSNPTFSHSLIANSGGSGSWNGAIGTNNGNNIDADPLFTDAANGDFTLQPGSIAYNAGNNAAYQTATGNDPVNATDLAGNPRLFDAIIDMGAIERQELPCPSSNALYVNANANGNNTGISWSNAFVDLQSALESTCTGVEEIWVAAGTYYPSSVNDRNETFLLKNNLVLYGGFTGNETQLSERDWTANETILSGDIDQSGDLTGNSYTLVNGSGTDTTAIIDGFTITGGNADVTSGDAFNPNRSGGGMFNNAGSPTVINCTFSGNTANQRGGGIYNSNSSAPTITNSTFLGNNAIFGGGMFNDTASSPIVTACAFSENSASSGGGGMYNFINTSPTVTNSAFSENTAGFGGGMTNSDNSSTTLTNCTFSANLATSNGGALFNFSSAPTIINTIIWNNTANGSTTTVSASVNNTSSNPSFNYSLIANSGGSLNWNAGIGTNNGNNIDADPLFTNAANADFTLQPGSPTINSGSNTAYQNATGIDPANTTDLGGSPRLFQTNIDIGAYEVDFNQTQWLGTTSEDWGNASNWDEGVPDNQAVALIRDMTQNIPKIDGFTTAEIKQLFINNSATLNVQGILKVQTRLDNEGILRFMSNTNSAGQFDEFTGNLTGSGEVRVERFIPQGNRAFRYISSSVNTTGSINANLQEGVTNASPEPNPNPGYGTHITGGTTANGFDATGTNNSSMFEWDEAGQNWIAVPNTITEPMNVGEAYALLIRGDRTTNLISNDAPHTSTTLRFRGALRTGNYPVPSSDLSSVVDQYNLVANPYQALVDVKTILQGSDATDLDENFIYIYDPTLGTRGGYAAVDISISDPSSTPYDGVSGTTNADENLLPNQAFFVKTTGTSPSLTFKENHKNVNANFATTFSDDNGLAQFNINLKRQPENLLVDGVTVRFDATYSNAVDDADAAEFWNFDEQLALFNSGYYLSIEKRAIPEEGDEIQLYTANYKTDTYLWQIDMSNINREAVLYDSYLDTETPIMMNEMSNISFSVDANVPESINPLRFSIRFMEETLSLETQQAPKFMVYPNPVTHNRFSIFGLAEGEKANIKIVSMSGKVVFTATQITEMETSIVLKKALSTGVYQLIVEQNKAIHHSKLIVKP